MGKLIFAKNHVFRPVPSRFPSHHFPPPGSPMNTPAPYVPADYCQTAEASSCFNTVQEYKCQTYMQLANFWSFQAFDNLVAED